ncbi:MAG: transketolase [Sphingomonadales bacterium]
MSKKSDAAIDQRTLANAVRALSMDAVQKANSGHPGMPMGMADVATVLFSKFMKFDPAWPDWPDRDRFVLSAGHGSMLLYSILHLTGYSGPTMEDIKNFRQLGHPCAGHPEYRELPGIETTTGPLGQGLGMAAGMALAERSLRAQFGSNVCDHHTYVISGDGCLMEGLSHEIISFAGHQKLDRLIVLWDNNSISIDGSTDLSVSDDQLKRFEAAGWHTQEIDGHDFTAIEKALEAAKKSDKPSLISCRTIIGFGAPNKQGTADTHGAPLGKDEVAAARTQLNWPHKAFEIPQEIKETWAGFGFRGKETSSAWKTRFGAEEKPVKEAFGARIKGHLPAGFSDKIISYKKNLFADQKAVATRKASGMALELINSLTDATVGGSADLTGSNNTLTKDLKALTSENPDGRYIYYGVREFGMAAIMNGLSLHGGFIPYGGTFLIFSDYARPAMRLAALMGVRSIYVMTHDSIGLGEDGPTHQPIEHLMSLRAIPNMSVLRPSCAIETAECWELALKNENGPTVLALTRQNLAAVREKHFEENMSARGGFILREAEGKPAVCLIATGSEVEVAVAAWKILQENGVATRVVSMPSMEIFLGQSKAYRKEVLGGNCLKVSIEAGITRGWEVIVGDNGMSVGIDRFGLSAPGADLFAHFGFTGEEVAQKVLKRIKATT